MDILHTQCRSSRPLLRAVANIPYLFTLSPSSLCNLSQFQYRQVCGLPYSHDRPDGLRYGASQPGRERLSCTCDTHGSLAILVCLDQGIHHVGEFLLGTRYSRRVTMLWAETYSQAPITYVSKALIVFDILGMSSLLLRISLNSNYHTNTLESSHRKNVDYLGSY